MITCVICSKAFKTWDIYHAHHIKQHKTVEDTGVPRLDFTDGLRSIQPTANPYGMTKQEIVASWERQTTYKAWFTPGMLNPLMGRDEGSVEPVWDRERNIL